MSLMGGTWKEALEVPTEIFNRYIGFANIEEELKRKNEETNN